MCNCSTKVISLTSGLVCVLQPFHSFPAFMAEGHVSGETLTLKGALNQLFFLVGFDTGVRGGPCCVPSCLILAL